MSLAVNKPLPCREVPTQYPKGLRNRTQQLAFPPLLLKLRRDCSCTVSVYFAVPLVISHSEITWEVSGVNKGYLLLADLITCYRAVLSAS